MELAEALAASGLTSLRLVRRPGRFELGLARDWDPETRFEDYPARYPLDQVPCQEPARLGDADARRLIAGHAADGALSELESGMQAGRHEMVLMLCHSGLAMQVAHHVHSSVLGERNGFHALRAGGLRRHEPSTPEAVVLSDGLNLSRAMSFKCAAAGIPFGGSKTTVRSRPFSLDDRSRLGFVAYAIDRGFLITGPDMGFVPELIDVLSQSYTRHILCGPGGPLGHTGSPTALGVFLAMRVAAEACFGTASLAHRTVAIQGLGAVGLELAKLLVAEGASLIAADTDANRAREAARAVDGLRLIDPDQIVSAPCDVLAPCAVGGVLDERSIETLSCRMVFGSANNQLARSSIEGEIELARRLAERGILFAPDWSYTMGGVLAGYEEYVQRHLADSQRVKRAIEHAVVSGLRELFAQAARGGRTPTEIAYARFAPLVEPAAWKSAKNPA